MNDHTSFAPPKASQQAPLDSFPRRHIGPEEADLAEMLTTVGAASLDELVAQTVPESIRRNEPLQLPQARGEVQLLKDLQQIVRQNRVARSYLGMGYYGTNTPAVILRNVLENPGWYTAYTPYQPELSQGRLEALLNFQTVVSDLVGLPLANASLLDEATAAAEAMGMTWSLAKGKRRHFFVSDQVHPQTLAVIQTRAQPLGIDVVVGSDTDAAKLGDREGEFFGVLLQYPGTDGRVVDLGPVIEKAHEHGALAIVATDLLALTLLRPPGEFGADVVVGSSQRFGVPMGFGGPHAAYLATREKYKRQMPGRIIGVSRDAQGRPAYRMALQTREQHIRRDKATSNICTAQALLAVVASMYAVYHGPEGLRAIAQRVHERTRALAAGLERLGHGVAPGPWFDTLRVTPKNGASSVLSEAAQRDINLRAFDDGSLGIALDETVEAQDVLDLLCVFNEGDVPGFDLAELAAGSAIDARFARTTTYLTHEVFGQHHAEHEMLRYLKQLENKDLSLVHSMIPLGSCTMKLNATSEMIPLTWPELGNLHPFAPTDQAEGYAELCQQLEEWLCEITGFTRFSLQPNAGAQGEYAGLLTIRAYHQKRGDDHRDVCLIPTSAHGTNPASAVMAGMRVVAVACDDQGNIDVEDLKARAQAHRDQLGALMITYPSTHGVFEESIKEICATVHEHGGLVYMDGANMNAQVGLCRPADMGADVCHLNLHKTFCIPHGGGGPGMGPIGVVDRLAPFLPAHPLQVGEGELGPVSAAPLGSASILPISWAYIALMGPEGLKRATQVAILNANYMAARLAAHYDVLYTGKRGRVAHEFVLDTRPFKASAGIGVEDIAKRLMDYGFHAPTMSWPVAGTLMVEPTESEPKEELDRFCQALLSIRDEIREIEDGTADREDNVLRNAPHTIEDVSADAWSHPYSREKAAFPAPWLRQRKFWPPVSRVDNAYGDRHLVCTCPPMESYL